MILYLRDSHGNSIVDLECFIKTEEDHKFIELSVMVDIRYYSILLLSNRAKAPQIINDFSYIQELRGWLWEVYFNGQKSDPEKYDDVIKELREILKYIAEKYNLSYVED